MEISELYSIICSRRDNYSENSYTCRLITQGTAQISRKVGEESVEVIIASLSENNERLANEVADLLYHVLVLIAEKEITLTEIENILESRRR